MFRAEWSHNHSGLLEGSPWPSHRKHGWGWLSPWEAFRVHCDDSPAPTVVVLPQEQGRKLRKTMLDLEKQGLEAMEEILASSEPLDPSEVGDLFYDCVDTEIKFFK